MLPNERIDTIIKCNQDFGLYVKTLTEEQIKIAKETRNLIRDHSYPSIEKVAVVVGKTDLDTYENNIRNYVRSLYEHIYPETITQYELCEQSLRRQFTEDGMMYSKSTMFRNKK